MVSPHRRRSYRRLLNRVTLRMADTHMAGVANGTPVAGAGDAWLVRFAMVLAGLALGVFIVFPRTSPFAMLVMATPVLAAVLAMRDRSFGVAKLPMAAAGATTVYLLLNCLWAQTPFDAVGKAALFAAIAGVLWVAGCGLPGFSDRALRRWGQVAAAAFVLVLLYLLFEELTFHLVKRTVFNLLPFTRPDEKHIQLEGSFVKNIYLYVSNRSMAAMTLSLWAVLLWIMQGNLWPSLQRYRWPASIVLVAMAAFAISRSQHETSAITLAFSLLAVGLWLLSRKAALVLVGAAWVTSTMLIIPMAKEAYTHQKLHLAPWLPDTARHRIIIWGYTAEQVPKAPFLGVGIESGKVLDARAKHEQPPDHLYPRRTGTHSHNVYVQTWYELGAVGAVLICALGLSLLWSIGRLSERLQPYALATFVSAAAMISSSYGMWQPWFMASFGISALLFLVAAELARRTGSARTSR